jgi:cytochrome c556
MRLYSDGMRYILLSTMLVATACAGEAHQATPAHVHEGQGTAGPDTRQAVRFPPQLRRATLAHMREHLAILGEIQQAMGRGAYDAAAELAEHQLGLSSLAMHGAQEVGPLMPPGMQQAGVAMHRAASRFAVEATNAGATNDPRPAIAALGVLTAQCVACHASYRLVD